MRQLMRFLVRHIPRPILLQFSYTFSWLIAWLYRGHNYECPVCSGSFRKMLPYGNKGADNRLCPACLSLERHRLLWLFLHEKTNLFQSGIHVLHIAPEQPFLKHFRKTIKHYVTADLESPLADIKMDIRQMPFADNTFDALLCNHVLEHIDDLAKALSEIRRVLKPGAWAIVQVPLDYSLATTFEDAGITSRAERERIFGQYDHVRVFGRDYANMLSEAGFTVNAENYVATLPTGMAQRYRLDLQELVYQIFKPA